MQTRGLCPYNFFYKSKFDPNMYIYTEFKQRSKCVVTNMNSTSECQLAAFLL